MATATEMRSLAVEFMTGRRELNSYTQGSDRKYFFGKPDNIPGNTTQRGYSDCSSAVRKAIMAASGIDIGSNTSAQINNRTRKGMVVHTTEGSYPDEAALLPGDCLYFKGNTGHPLDVGHVEMYIGGGEICGHGSGTGPKIKNMRQYCASRSSAARRYFMAVRWIYADDESAGRPVLRKGMYDSAEVKTLQLDLISLGYSLGEYGADGDFGSATEAAVIAFQQVNGLAPDGIVGPATWAKIEEIKEGMGDIGDAVQPVPDEAPANGIEIAGGSWNVRTGPGVQYKSAGIVRGGEVLAGVELNGWTPVIYGGEVRFIGPSARKE